MRVGVCMSFYELEVQETYRKKIVVKADSKEDAIDVGGDVDFSMSDGDYVEDSFRVLSARRIKTDDVVSNKKQCDLNSGSYMLVEVMGDGEFAGLYKAAGFNSLADIESAFQDVRRVLDESEDVDECEVDKDELLCGRGIDRFFVEQVCLD